MCDRYTLTVDRTTIEKRFGAKFDIAQPSYDWTPTCNAAPLQMLPIIRTYATDRIDLARGEQKPGGAFKSTCSPFAVST